MAGSTQREERACVLGGKMFGHAFSREECPRCGYIDELARSDPPTSHVQAPLGLDGRAAVRSYVATLGSEAREWLLALYVDSRLKLLAVEPVGRGDIGNCRVNFARILCRGHQLKAAGFILVHNHPSGDPTPSPSDIAVTRRLHHTSKELELPLLDHFVVAGGTIVSVGGF